MSGNIGKHKAIKSVWASVFLVTYVMAFFVFPFHSLRHLQPEEELCYEADNACHLRLVHHDLENGCDHDFHYTNDAPVCEICPLLQHQSEKELFSKQFETPTFSETEELSLDLLIPVDYYFQQIFNRGPPEILS